MATIHDLRDAFELLEERAPRTIPERTPRQRRVLPLLAACVLIAAVAVVLVVARPRHHAAPSGRESPSALRTATTCCPPPARDFRVTVNGRLLHAASAVPVRHGSLVHFAVRLANVEKRSVHDVEVTLGKPGAVSGTSVDDFWTVARTTSLAPGQVLRGSWRATGRFAYGAAPVAISYAQGSVTESVGTLRIAAH